MTLALRSARRHPMWLISLVAALAIGAVLVLPSSRSEAAPPANDNCGTNGAGAQTLPLAVAVQGDTSEASDDYDAVITPTANPSQSAVPADGPDVVYKLTLTDGQFAQVTVKAPFQASIYATATSEGIGSPRDCGRAYRSVFGDSIEVAANDGGSLLLFDISEDDDGLSTDWYLVVDGWTTEDRGRFEIAASLTSLTTGLLGNNSQAIIGSLLFALEERVDKFTQWDFAEGSTREDFEVFITLLSDVNQDVTVFYFADPTTLPAGAANPIMRTVSLTAGERKTLRGTNPAEFGAGEGIDFATRVVGSAPFQASAIMYSNRDVGLGVPTNGVQNIQGEHN